MGVLCSSFFKGFLVEKFSIRVVFVVASVLPLVLFVSGVMLIEERYGYLEKEEKEEQLINSNDKKKEDSLFHKLIVFYCQKKIIIPTTFIIFLLWAPPGYEQSLFYFSSEVLKFTPKDFGYIFLCSTIVSLIIIQIYKKTEIHQQHFFFVFPFVLSFSTLNVFTKNKSSSFSFSFLLLKLSPVNNDSILLKNFLTPIPSFADISY